MKKHLLHLFIISAFILSFSSCEDFEYRDENNQENSSENNQTTSYSLSISPTSVQLAGNSGAFTIHVKSNQAWTVSLNNQGRYAVTGLRLSNYSGYGNGVITVYYDKPDGNYYDESGTVVVVGEESGAAVCRCYRRFSGFGY